jgi:hypothetical protein
MGPPQPLGAFAVKLRTSMAAVLCLSACSFAQRSGERTFPVPVARIQSALKRLPGGTSGPLPLLDGFVASGARDLQNYERPFYQCTVRVAPSAAGGSVVRVTAKITAWNSGPAHSRYEVLPSNGRLESDLLDRLQQMLGADAAATTTASATAASTNPATTSPPHKLTPAPELSAPMPQFPNLSAIAKPRANSAPQNSALEQEAKGLEELIRNQAHPTNLVAVKADQTPVLQNPSSDAQVIFLASAEDEFETLDSNPEWIHVRISGLSRGWLLRSSVEILDGSQPTSRALAGVSPMDLPSSAPAGNKLFSVSGEEEGSFPGDWAPLKGKTVWIVSIQQAPGTGVITSPQDKMHFAENIFKTKPAEKSSAGLVLIFDAEDGGMVAAPRAALDLWKTGALSEQAFWKQCYLDPPEILGSRN